MTATLTDFQKIVLKVGKIVEAVPHPNADRLLVLQVDLGTERRQLVAGIRGAYAPEELVGRSVVVVANLEPATIRGVESQGMVLAAKQGETLTVFVPDRVIPPGADIH